MHAENNMHNSKLNEFKDNSQSKVEVDEEVYKKIKKKYTDMSDKTKDELVSSMSWFFLTDDIIKKTRLQIQAKMKIRDTISLFLAAIGVLTNILASYNYIDFEKVEEGDDSISILVKTSATNAVQICRILTSISTFILLIFIFLHYKTRLTFLIFKQKADINSTLYSTGLIYPLIAELIFCSIHSFPYMNNVKVKISTTGSNPQPVEVDIDLLISILVPLRAYLLFRIFAFYSAWADDRAEKICNECNASGGVGFAVKAELKERPYTVVSFLLVLSILIFGYGLRNIELAFMQKAPIKSFQDWRYIWNGFWCIVITVLTVGYGDYYPQTHVGRLIAVVACLWGTFLISLMVVSLTNSVDFTPQEQKAYDEIKKELTQKKLKCLAVEYIKATTQLKYLIEAEEDASFNQVDDRSQAKKEMKKALFKFKKTLDEFRHYRKLVILQENQISTETILYRLNTLITEDMENLINLSNVQITSLIGHISYSQDIQSQIKSYAKRLNKLTSALHETIQGKKSDKEVDSSKNL